MSKQEPRDHHYAPQFYLRNFAVDAEKRKIATVAKNGHFAVWSVRSIEGLGYERDFYVHLPPRGAGVGGNDDKPPA